MPYNNREAREMHRWGRDLNALVAPARTPYDAIEDSEPEPEPVPADDGLSQLIARRRSDRSTT